MFGHNNLSPSDEVTIYAHPLDGHIVVRVTQRAFVTAHRATVPVTSRHTMLAWMTKATE
jgi:hypothetical protein